MNPVRVGALVWSICLHIFYNNVVTAVDHKVSHLAVDRRQPAYRNVISPVKSDGLQSYT